MTTPIDSVVALPRAIFKHLDIHKHEAALLAGVALYAETEQKISARLIQRLAWFPRILGHAIIHDFLPFDAQNEALSDPYVAFRTTMEHYAKLAPRLEDTYLVGSPAALALLVSSIRVYKKRTRRSEKEYLDLIAEKDPNRRIWLADEPAWPELVRGFEARPEFKSTPTAPWCYFRLSRQASGELPLALGEVLATDDEYLFRSAALFAQRKRQGQPAPAWGPLLAGIHSPRWAFHALRDNLAESSDVAGHLFEILKHDLAWLVELTVQPIWDDQGRMHCQGTATLAGAAFKPLYLEAVRQNYASPLIQDFHCYSQKALLPEKVSQTIAGYDYWSRRLESLPNAAAR
jgi:hypothetical protein